MVQANELRIGNWVYDGEKKRNCIIAEIRETAVLLDQTEYGGTKLSWLRPIPLSPDILLSAGFVSCCDGNEYRIGLPLGNGTDLVIEVLGENTGPYDALISDSVGDEAANNYSYLKPQRYLHQLQNLYFALTNCELTINL